MLTSARQLEAQGKLDEALDRYLLTLRSIGDLFSSQAFFWSDRGITPEVHHVFLQIANWAGKPEQTPDRLRAGIARLEATDAEILRLSDFLKNNFILARRLIQGDSNLHQYFYYENDQRLQEDVLWSTLMPWEIDRALRVLSVISNAGLDRLQSTTIALEHQGENPDQQGRGLELIAWQAENFLHLLPNDYAPATQFAG